jgi:uracil-DNA glycosylase family 4
VIHALPSAIKKCRNCSLYQQCRAPVSPVFRHAEIMVIGRNPGQDEDRKGEPFVGRAGRLLDEFLERAGWRRSWTYITNVVKCFTALPRANRPPTREEIRACIPWLYMEIQILRPSIILAAGGEAIQTFHASMRPGHANGRLIPIIERPFDRLLAESRTRVFGFFHPSYVLRNAGKERHKYWETAEKLRYILEDMELI